MTKMSTKGATDQQGCVNGSNVHHNPICVKHAKMEKQTAGYYWNRPVVRGAVQPRMDRWSICLALIMVAFVPISEACRCAYVPPEKHYCNANLVAVLRIVRAGDPSNHHERVWEFDVVDEFKVNGTDARGALDNGLIYSGTHSCGLTLGEGTDYLVATQISPPDEPDSEPAIHVISCSYVREVDSLRRNKPEEYEAMKNGYNCSQ